MGDYSKVAQGLTVAEMQVAIAAQAADGLRIVPPSQIARAWQSYPLVPCEVTLLRAEVASLKALVDEYKTLTTHLWDMISKGLGGGIPSITKDTAAAPKADAAPEPSKPKPLPATAIRRQAQATGLRLLGE